MKSFKIEKEYGIDYVVIRFGDKDLRDFKKIIKENYNFLKNLNFKFILNDNKGDYFILYMKKNKIHKLHGPAYQSLFDGINHWYLDGNKFSSEEEYINEIRRKTLSEILNEKN